MNKNNIPEHIAIIMDGNGRWAAAQGKPRKYGHQAGVETVRRITTECARLGVKFLTLYTFSTENWNRPADEVSALMGLVLSSLEDEIFMKNNVRFRVIGDMERLPDEVRSRLQETIDHTAGNTSMTLVVALSYSSRWEITQAVKQIVRHAQLSSCADEQVGVGHEAGLQVLGDKLFGDVFSTYSTRTQILDDVLGQFLHVVHLRDYLLDGLGDFPPAAVA